MYRPTSTHNVQEQPTIQRLKPYQLLWIVADLCSSLWVVLCLASTEKQAYFKLLRVLVSVRYFIIITHIKRKKIEKLYVYKQRLSSILNRCCQTEKDKAQYKHTNLGVSVNVKNCNSLGDRSTYKIRRTKRLPINSTESFPQTKVANTLMVKFIYFLVSVICLVGVTKTYVKF